MNYFVDRRSIVGNLDSLFGVAFERMRTQRCEKSVAYNRLDRGETF